MAGRSARKFILRPKAFSPKVVCVPLFVTVLAGGFTNVSCLSINTTLWKYGAIFILFICIYLSYLFVVRRDVY
jgi:hypothetical protein